MDPWFAGCAALAIDRVSTLTAVRRGADWALSAVVEAGPLRISVVDDYRDEIVYLEVEGLPDLPAAVVSLRDHGFQVRRDESTFLRGQGHVVSGRVHRHGRWGADKMVEVGHFLWCVDKLAATGRLATDEPLPPRVPAGVRGARKVARAAGRSPRPWQAWRAATFSAATPYGDLAVYADLPGGARWLARVGSTLELPSNPSEGPRWMPNTTRRDGAGQLALVWHEPATTVHGAPVPSLRQVLARLDATSLRRPNVAD